MRQKLFDFLVTNEVENEVFKIPQNSNWTLEMFHQVRCSYEETYGSRLISDLIEKRVPLKGKGINLFAYKFFGEASKIAIDINRTLKAIDCLLYTSPSPRDKRQSRMPSSA